MSDPKLVRVECTRDVKHDGQVHKAGAMIEVTPNQLAQNPDAFRVPPVPEPAAEPRPEPKPDPKPEPSGKGK